MNGGFHVERCKTWVIVKVGYLVDFQALNRHAYASEGGSEDVEYVSCTIGVNFLFTNYFSHG
jgi:hypothetical protein